MTTSATAREHLACNPCNVEAGRLHVCTLASIPADLRHVGQTILYGRRRAGDFGMMLPLTPFRESAPETNRPDNGGPVNLYAVPLDLTVGHAVWVVDHHDGGPERLRVCRVVRVGFLGEPHGLGIELEVLGTADLPAAN
jgi:hypothetical protein